MIIGVDGNEANVENKVGVSVYSLKLLQYFHKKSNQSCRFVIFLKKPPLPELPKPNPFFKYKVVAGNFFWSRFFLPLALYKNRFSSQKIDVFFSPAHYTPRFSPVPLIVTIHDLSYFYYPEEFLKKDLYKLVNWTKRSIERAKKIIAVSQTTKRDLMKFYHLPEEKIAVIYNGYERQIKKTKEIKRWSLKKNKFILFVGTIQPRKNLLILIKAFIDFNKLNPEFKLIITGKKGWLYKTIFEEIKKNDLDKKIILTGYLPTEEVNWLYQNALFFVHPSLYEGFGIPVLEAMSFDCPVLCSSAASLPEIVGEAGIFFDPKNKEDLLKKMLILAKDFQLRQELIQKGKKRIKFFSWEKTGEQTLNLLKTL
ncbi:MAG: glycosyltransferase family 1 protein [Microgenomates group bacterium]|nr:glycosyltransferase family 1 protein [Microgenomates group bacterium]